MTPNPSPISACPGCGCELVRRRRSLLDRLRSIFEPRARYRCAARCGWEGLLPRVEPRRAGPLRHSLSYRHREVLDASRSR